MYFTKSSASFVNTWLTHSFQPTIFCFVLSLFQTLTSRVLSHPTSSTARVLTFEFLGNGCKPTIGLMLYVMPLTHAQSLLGTSCLRFRPLNPRAFSDAQHSGQNHSVENNPCNQCWVVLHTATHMAGAPKIWIDQSGLGLGLTCRALPHSRELNHHAPDS